MNYFQITKCDLLNGDGIRVVLWVAGCSHHCKGCQNPYTWDKDGGVVFDEKAKHELFDAINNSYINGVTFSGGDPLFKSNRKPVADLITEIKNLYPDKTVWLYTGYKFEELKTFPEIKSILGLIDVIVDGEFKEELKDYDYKWAGSTNQRVLRIGERDDS